MTTPAPMVRTAPFRTEIDLFTIHGLPEDSHVVLLVTSSVIIVADTSDSISIIIAKNKISRRRKEIMYRYRNI
jgi:hypothetical protein